MRKTKPSFVFYRRRQKKLKTIFELALLFLKMVQVILAISILILKLKQ